MIWNYSQPISDNMEEAVSGVKGELGRQALRRQSAHAGATAELIQAQMATVKGVEDLGIFRIVGQPNLNSPWIAKPRRDGAINVADIQDAIQTAVGSNAVTQVQQGEARYDVTLRYRKAISRHAGGDRRHAPAGAIGRTSFAGAADQGLNR